MANFEITTELRPCIVNGKRALFHRWEQYSDVIGASPLVGGHSAGQISYVLAICEDEDGQVFRAKCCDVRFIDNKYSEYSFESEGKDGSI